MIVVGEQDKKYDAMIYERDGRRGLMCRDVSPLRTRPAAADRDSRERLAGYLHAVRKGAGGSRRPPLSAHLEP